VTVHLHLGAPRRGRRRHVRHDMTSRQLIRARPRAPAARLAVEPLVLENLPACDGEQRRDRGERCYPRRALTMNVVERRAAVPAAFLVEIVAR
jgi:hypothetical protein